MKKLPQVRQLPQNGIVSGRLLWSFVLPLCAAAQVCNPADIQGTYGVQLSGTSTISGKPTPVAAIGRLEFDGRNQATGYSSVNFNGFFLGNPVTGTYEAKPDCTMTWSLQDDSGAWQHFSGKASPDGRRVEFRQTDPGAGGRGVLQRTPDACDAAAFRGAFAFSMSGEPTPFGEGDRLNAKGDAEADGAGNLRLKWAKSETNGSYSVDSDCFVQLDLSVPSGAEGMIELVTLRGILVNGGKDLLAVQTDPERVASARFVAK